MVLFLHMRNGKIDFLKGILIWSVVFGHCINSLLQGTGYHNELHVALRTFDMPMFMLISGFLLQGSLKRHNVWQLLANRTTGIVIPALLWIGVSIVICHPNNYYFLWAIYGSTVTMVIIQKTLNNKLLQIISVIIITIGLHTTNVRLMNIPFLLPFFAVGYYLPKLETNNKIGLTTSLLFIAMLFFWKTDYTIWNIGANIFHEPSKMIPIISFRFIIGLIGIIAVTWLLSKIYDKTTNGPLTQTITGIGRETLSIYLIQYIIVEVGIRELIKHITHNGIGNPFGQITQITGYLIAPLISFIIVFCIYHAIKYLKKYKFSKVLFGFKIF